MKTLTKENKRNTYSVIYYGDFHRMATQINLTPNLYDSYINKTKDTEFSIVDKVYYDIFNPSEKLVVRYLENNSSLNGNISLILFSEDSEFRSIPYGDPAIDDVLKILHK